MTDKSLIGSGRSVGLKSHVCAWRSYRKLGARRARASRSPGKLARVAERIVHAASKIAPTRPQILPRVRMKTIFRLSDFALLLSFQPATWQTCRAQPGNQDTVDWRPSPNLADLGRRRRSRPERPPMIAAVEVEGSGTGAILRLLISAPEPRTTPFEGSSVTLDSSKLCKPIA